MFSSAHRTDARPMPRPATRAALVWATLLSTLIVLASTAAPASAATRIEQSANYTCTNARIGVSPPRVWANVGRPEPVVWMIAVQRWNGSRWYAYSQSNYMSTFDYYGRSVTSWSMHNTRNGGRYINSRLWVPVAYRGYYRVISGVATSDQNSVVRVGGASNYCFMP